MIPYARVLGFTCIFLVVVADCHPTPPPPFVPSRANRKCSCSRKQASSWRGCTAVVDTYRSRLTQACAMNVLHHTTSTGMIKTIILIFNINIKIF